MSTTTLPPLTAATNPANPQLDAALEYARRGWPVFPCKPKSKAPLTRHGFKCGR